METVQSKWKGMRAIVVARQSDDKDGTASTEAQLDHIGKNLAVVGMSVIDKELLEGVSAVSPARITEILQELFKRKSRKNDFDVIAWQIEDRATRGGGEFGMWVEHEAKRHGLRVYFVDSDMGDTPYASVVRVAKYEAAKEESVGKGRRSTQGHDLAKKKGFYRTAGHTPMGCDRLYYGDNDQPKFIIRNLGNGLQEQIDYATRVVIGRFGTIGKKSRNRYKKQRNEYSLLMPGDHRKHRVVRVIFYLRYKKGWRGCRIADYLNRLNVLAPKGGDWSPRQVESVYENEAYTGVTYNDQTYSGRFFRRDKVMGFVALDRDACELVLKKTFTPKLRPMDEWDRIDQPHMYDFLPRDVRDLAIEAQATMWQHRLDPTRPKRKPNAHPASEYLLSGRLVAKQDQSKEPLVGTLSGPRGKTILYYRHRRGRRGRRKGSVYNNLIPVRPLHEALVKLLAEVLIDRDDLRERLTEFVIEQRKLALQETPNIAQMEAERTELNEQIVMIISTLTGAALADARATLERLGERRNFIEAQLKGLRSAHTNDTRPVEAVVEDALAVLAEESQRLLNLPAEPLREAVNRLIAYASVDMETKAVELGILLPTWATAAKPKLKTTAKNAGNEAQRLCPPAISRSQVMGWTHRILTAVDCEYDRRHGSHTVTPCYRCRRRAA